MSEKPTIVISGVGPTFHIYERLNEIYNVAVYDLNHANRISVQINSDKVICPMNGAQPPLYEKARNDAALAVAEIVAQMNQRPIFSLNGRTPQKLEGMRDWMPGLTLAHLNELYANLYVLERYHDHAGVRGVVVHEDVTPKFRALALWGKAKGIPVIHMPHNNCYAQVQPDIHDKSIADWILAASPYMRDWYAERGFSKERIKVIGFPPWDGWADIDITRERARAMFHFDDGVPTVTLCTGWPQRTNYVDDHSTTEAASHLVLNTAQKLGWNVIWKMHPGDATGQEERYVKLMAMYGINGVVTRDHLAYALKAADMVISTGPSNVLVEAGINDVPPALFNLRGYGFDGEPPWVVGLEETAVMDTMFRLQDGREWRDKRAAFVKRYAFKADGKSGKRAVRQIKGIVGV